MQPKTAKRRSAFRRANRTMPRRRIDIAIEAIDYKNPDLLKKFVTESGKILPRRITGMPAQLRIFRNRQFAAEKKVPKRVLVQNAMDGDAFIGLREINAIVLRPVAIQLFPLTLDHAKPLRIEMIQVFG